MLFPTEAVPTDTDRYTPFRAGSEGRRENDLVVVATDLGILYFLWIAGLVPSGHGTDGVGEVLLVVFVGLDGCTAAFDPPIVLIRRPSR